MVGVLVADEPKSETPGLEAATVNNGIFRIILFINQFTALEMQKETISLIEKANTWYFWTMFYKCGHCVLVADELKSETAGLEAVNNGILRMIMFINQFNLILPWENHFGKRTAWSIIFFFELWRIMIFSHRGLKLDGAIRDFAEPLWRLKTGHFTT